MIQKIEGKIKEKFKNKKIRTIYYITLFILFVIAPICFDVKLYIGGAYQTDLLTNFPMSLFECWEHKLILNRFIFYILFKITNIFVNANNIILFEIILKLIYGIISIFIIKFFTNNTKEFFEKYKIKKEIVFFILYSVVIGMSVYSNLQTEITALLILMIAIVFAIKKNSISKIFAGFLISTLFFFKGITLLYSIIVLAVMILNKNNKKDIIFVILWSFIFFITEIVLLNIFIPSELTQIYLSSKYMTNDVRNYNIIAFTFMGLSLFPTFAFGLISYINNNIINIKNKNFKMIILESFLWLLLIIGVIMQGAKYIYQIGLLFPACIFSIIQFIYYYKNKQINEKNKLVIMILIFIFLITSFCMNAIYYMEIYQGNIKNIENEKILSKKIPDLKDEEILYIGNGLSAYYIQAKSYTRYTTTIFLANNNEIYLNSQYINELKKQIKEYKGKYIIIDDKEFKKKFRLDDKTISFINENYEFYTSTNMEVSEKENQELSSIYIRKNI